MPDITMCSDIDCLKSTRCYRFLAKPDPWQSYFTESPRTGDDCADFWEVGLEQQSELKEAKHE